MVFRHTHLEGNSLVDYLARVRRFFFPFGTHLVESPFKECHGLLSLDFGGGCVH